MGGEVETNGKTRPRRIIWIHWEWGPPGYEPRHARRLERCEMETTEYLKRWLRDSCQEREDET